MTSTRLSAARTAGSLLSAALLAFVPIRGAASAAVVPPKIVPPLGGIPAAGERPIGEITRGMPDVSVPGGATGDLPARYGLGQPVQIGPKTAALLCNLRVIGPDRIDYENGTDIFVFDALRALAEGEAIALTRNERETDAGTGEPRFIVKYPACAGFWPLGALRSDGAPHPGAGKGFAFCRALSFVGSGDTLPWELFSKPSTRSHVEVVHLSFDGRRVAVGRRASIRDERGWRTEDGWQVIAPGLQPAIPDGDHLLLAVSARKVGMSGTGVCRFGFREGEWRPVGFTLVTGGAEPSLARRADGALIFSARPGPTASKSIQLWASSDAGATWGQILDAANVRSETPVSVHATPDGRIYVVANAPGMTNPTLTVKWHRRTRDRLVMWQLADRVAQLMPPQLIRDCPEEYGAPPDGTMWYCDHPVSASVRLGDGRWHGLLAYRLLAFGGKAGETLLPQTGCCVEEVPTSQPAVPPWRF